jgi:adenine deaminase
MKSIIQKRISVAAGREKADLVLKGGKVINVFTEEIIEGDVAIVDGYIAGIGDSYEGNEVIELDGRYIAPGLIDGHVHIESSMATPEQYARAIVPRGTTTIIADPHEVANVNGMDGIEYILNASENVPMDVFVMLPSCVPATDFENSGAVLEAKQLSELINHPRVLGLGELMDYPAVIGGTDRVVEKIKLAQDNNKIIDGHGPLIDGSELNAYVTAGVRTEHECESVEEMINRLRLGMYILIREGSAARNLSTLVQGVSKENLRRCLFCTDDRHPGDILKDGHIDNNVRLAMECGLPALSAIRMATLNAAECYRLYDRGAIAPGYLADLIVVDNLRTFKVEKVFKAGKLVADDGLPLFEAVSLVDDRVRDTVNLGDLDAEKLKLHMESDIARVMKIAPKSLVTEHVTRKVGLRDGVFDYVRELDILKLAVLERHKATGNVGLGLVEGFEMKDGAIASTVAHDSHNLIIIGDTDDNIMVAAKEIEKIGGGLVVVKSGKVIGSLPLPIAGIMSDKTLSEMDAEHERLMELAYSVGVNKEIDPFMLLAFLALPVIPELKLTDIGLFDVVNFEFVDLCIHEHSHKS